MPKLAATAATNAAATKRSKRRKIPLPRHAPGRGALAACVVEIKGGLALNGDIFVSDERAWLQLLIGNIGVRARHCRWPTPANSLCTHRHPGNLRWQSGGILKEALATPETPSRNRHRMDWTFAMPEWHLLGAVNRHVRSPRVLEWVRSARVVQMSTFSANSPSPRPHGCG